MKTSASQCLSPMLIKCTFEIAHVKKIGTTTHVTKCDNSLAGRKRESLSQTGANSRVLETDAEDMISRDHECYFSVEHAAKDSGIALKLAEEQGAIFWQNGSFAILTQQVLNPIVLFTSKTSAPEQ